MNDVASPTTQPRHGSGERRRSKCIDHRILITRRAWRLLRTHSLGILLMALSGRRTRIVRIADRLRSSIDAAYSTTLQRPSSIQQQTTSYLHVTTLILFQHYAPICVPIIDTVLRGFGVFGLYGFAYDILPTAFSWEGKAIGSVHPSGCLSICLSPPVSTPSFELTDL